MKRSEAIRYYKKVKSDLSERNGFLTASWLAGVTQKQLENDWQIVYPQDKFPNATKNEIIKRLADAQI
jgi:hypothetical protein